MNHIETIKMFFGRKPDQGCEDDGEKHAKLDRHKKERFINEAIRIFGAMVRLHKGSVGKTNGKKQYDKYGKF